MTTESLIIRAQFVMDLHSEDNYALNSIRHILWGDSSPEARNLAHFCDLMLEENYKTPHITGFVE